MVVLKQYSVLIPLLSKQENNPEFLEKALENAFEANVLLVIDKDAMVGQFGFAASEIMQGNLLLEELKQKILEKKILCNDIMEWGNTEQKILQLALLKKSDKIAMVEQENKYFQDLLKKLKEKESEKIELIKIEKRTEEKEKNILEMIPEIAKSENSMQSEEEKEKIEHKTENAKEKEKTQSKIENPKAKEETEKEIKQKKEHNVKILNQVKPKEEIKEAKPKSEEDQPIIRQEEVEKAFNNFMEILNDNRKKLEKMINERRK